MPFPTTLRGWAASCAGAALAYAAAWVALTCGRIAEILMGVTL